MFKFRLSTQRYGEKCCSFAWCLEEGFTQGFFYERRKEVIGGIFADSPDWGGARSAGGGGGGGGGGDHDFDSTGRMMAIAWFNLLCELEDTMPNADQVAGSIQLDAIKETELFDEYVACVSDANIAPEDILRFQPWKALWKDKFPQVAIVEVKNLLSKVRCPSHSGLCSRLFNARIVCYRIASAPGFVRMPACGSRTRRQSASG